MSLETARPYDPVAIGLHRLIAALSFGQVLRGFSMERVKSMAPQLELIQWHKSFGLLILGLAALRLLWRAAMGRAPAAPGLPPTERLAAGLVQAHRLR